MLQVNASFRRYKRKCPHLIQKCINSNYFRSASHNVCVCLTAKTLKQSCYITKHNIILFGIKLHKTHTTISFLTDRLSTDSKLTKKHYGGRMEKRFGVYPASGDIPHSHQIIQKNQITRGLFAGNYGTSF